MGCTEQKFLTMLYQLGMLVRNKLRNIFRRNVRGMSSKVLVEVLTHAAPQYEVKVNQSHHRPKDSRGFQEVKVLRLCDNDPEWW